MKRLSIITAAMAAILFVSCTTGTLQTQDEYKYNITIGNLSNDSTVTRAIKTSWTQGDKVFIWLDGHATLSPDIEMMYDGGTWNVSKTDESYTPNATGTCIALYEGCNNINCYSLSNGILTRSIELGSLTKGTPYYPMACHCNSTYVLSENTITAQFTDWTFDTGIQIVITGLDANGYYKLECKQLTGLSGIKIAESAILDKPTTDNTAAGYPNTDGVAFYFARNSFSFKTDYSFHLTHYERPQTLEYEADLTFHYEPLVIPDKQLSIDQSCCTGIRINNDRFGVRNAGIAPNGVSWVQLWKGGPRFANRNESATNDWSLGQDYPLNSTLPSNFLLPSNDYWCLPDSSAFDELINATKGTTKNVSCEVVEQHGAKGFLFKGQKSPYSYYSLFIPADADDANGCFVRLAIKGGKYIVIKESGTDMSKVTSTSRYARMMLW